MGILIGSLAAVTMLLLASSVMFSTFLTTSASGAQSLKSWTQINKQRSGSALSITSATFNGVDNGGLSAEIDNMGSESVVQFEQMDVIVEYSDPSDNSLQTYLEYQSAGIGANQWTISATGVQPDSFNPGLWDSDETLYIDMEVDPEIKSGTSALIVVATPWGVSDQTPIIAP